jgi:hypothetical protein
MLICIAMLQVAPGEDGAVAHEGDKAATAQLVAQRLRVLHAAHVSFQPLSVLMRVREPAFDIPAASDRTESASKVTLRCVQKGFQATSGNLC